LPLAHAFLIHKSNSEYEFDSTNRKNYKEHREYLITNSDDKTALSIIINTNVRRRYNQEEQAIPKPICNRSKPMYMGFLEKR